MTVKELITKLREFDMDLEIIYYSDEDGTIKGINDIVMNERLSYVEIS